MTQRIRHDLSYRIAQQLIDALPIYEQDRVGAFHVLYQALVNACIAFEVECERERHRLLPEGK